MSKPASDDSMDGRFPKSLRLVSQQEFSRVFKRGKTLADGVLVVHAIRSFDRAKPASKVDDEATRLGLSISKKVGSAPQRNYWKRLIREAFRLQKKRLPEGLDIVVRPRKGATPEFDKVCKSLFQLTRRLERRL